MLFITQSPQSSQRSYFYLEVVSKFQIRFKGPAKRDYISNLGKIKVCIKRQAVRESAAYMGM